MRRPPAAPRRLPLLAAVWAAAAAGQDGPSAPASASVSAGGLVLLQAGKLSQVRLPPATALDSRRRRRSAALPTAAPCSAAVRAPCQPSLLAGGASANRSAADPLFGAFAPASFSLAPQWDLKGPEGPTLVADPRFGPQGVPNAGLLLEMHLRHATLRALRSGGGGLAGLLLSLSQELSRAAGVAQRRIAVLAIHERYQRLDPIEASWSDGGESLRAVRSEEEVVVRFEVKPVMAEGEPDPGRVLEALRRALAAPDSGLLRGPLGATLQNATLTLTLADHFAAPPKRREVQSMSAMALPIGLSAAFTGVLIWIAAW